MIRWYFLYHGILCLLITEKVLFWNFWRWKYGVFLSQKVDRKMKFTDYWKVLLLNFLEIRSFFEPKSWWKDRIYWLLKVSCFELFGNGKYGDFWSQKVQKRWYLFGLFELYVIFQYLKNMIFCAADEQYIKTNIFDYPHSWFQGFPKNYLSLLKVLMFKKWIYKKLSQF